MSYVGGKPALVRVSLEDVNAGRPKEAHYMHVDFSKQDKMVSDGVGGLYVISQRGTGAFEKSRY